jgi:hypothetical protein
MSKDVDDKRADDASKLKHQFYAVRERVCLKIRAQSRVIVVVDHSGID